MPAFLAMAPASPMPPMTRDERVASLAITAEEV
jgi:hypothetical protein